MSDKHDLQLLISGHIPVICIETHEERRVLELIQQTAIQQNTPVFRWTVTEGLQRLDINLDPQKHVSDPQDVLRHIKSSKLQGLYILLDFNPYLSEPINTRLLKEIAMSFDGDAGKLILISHQLKLPESLRRLSVNFQLCLPDTSALEKLIKQEAQSWQQQNKTKVRTDRDTLQRLIQNLSGLSHNDARRLIRNAIVDDGAITENDLPEVMQTKYKLLNQDDVLAFEYDTAHFSDVGGMEKLKSWLLQRQAAFQNNITLPAELDKPKGILLLGVQGCGKSLAAKAVAGIWDAPLLRLDFGQLYNKYVGETERNLRQALHTAEVMAPCVLWIDELEKGVTSSDDDQGTSKRILATLLTWMAENKHAVFIVATANQIHALPPELIRKGRLDEIFFVDLPDQTSRESIFKIHLEKRKIPTNDLNLAEIANATDGFSGAEIEQAVVSVMYANHTEKSAISTQILLDEIRQTRPLSVIMSEQISELRHWAQHRTIPVD